MTAKMEDDRALWERVNTDIQGVLGFTVRMVCRVADLWNVSRGDAMQMFLDATMRFEFEFNGDDLDDFEYDDIVPYLEQLMRVLSKHDD